MATRHDSAVPVYLAGVKRRVAAARIDGRLYAFDTGAVINGRATAPLTTYAVRDIDGNVQTRT